MFPQIIAVFTLLNATTNQVVDVQEQPVNFATVVECQASADEYRKTHPEEFVFNVNGQTMVITIKCKSR